MDRKTQASFEHWLNSILVNNDFYDSVAFNFNLYEGDDSFHIQLISTSSFSEDDDDWACDEVYSSGDNIFQVPKHTTGQSWQDGLSFFKALVKNYLDTGKYTSKLIEKRAIGIGFVDGDIEIIR